MNHYEQATQEVRDAFNALCKGRVEAAVKAEREACAKVAEDMNAAVLAMLNVTRQPVAIAAAIRARGNP